MSNGSWRVDETYVKIKGRWTYLYRAVDSHGQTIDFLLSAKRRCGSGQALLPQGVGPASHRKPAHDHRGQERRVPKSSGGDEAGRRAVVALTVTPSEILEQHFGAGPPGYQTPDRSWTRLWQLLDGATNTGGLRGNGDDQKGAGSEDRRQRHDGTGGFHRQSYSGLPLELMRRDRRAGWSAINTTLCNRTGEDPYEERMSPKLAAVRSVDARRVDPDQEPRRRERRLRAPRVSSQRRVIRSA